MKQIWDLITSLTYLPLTERSSSPDQSGVTGKKKEENEKVQQVNATCVQNEAFGAGYLWLIQHSTPVPVTDQQMMPTSCSAAYTPVLEPPRAFANHDRKHGQPASLGPICAVSSQWKHALKKTDITKFFSREQEEAEEDQPEVWG